MSQINFTQDERFDGLYMNVANTARGIEPMLDTVFSFLRRKTDFFSGPATTAGDGSSGTELAVSKVNEVLMKHVRLYEEDMKKKKDEDDERKKKKKRDKMKKKEVKKKKDDEEEGVVEMGKDGFDISDVSSSKEDHKKKSQDEEKIKQSSKEAKEEEEEETEAKSKSDTTTTTTKKTSPPLGNGGTVPGKYTWTQTLSEVTINIPLSQPTRGRDVTVTISKQHLLVVTHHPTTTTTENKNTIIIDAPLTKTIQVDESVWTIEDSTRLVINLQKINTMEWWEGVCVGDPTIDVKEVEPENSQLGDLDGETRKTVEKMMFDQRQKALGLPTSEEKEKLDMLEKFKLQHPELDFSNAKIS